ncbi:MAG TPA: hypothetical protein VGL50_05330 [Steroidobacteraceae bacterium]|jgi:hypothetical protein
MPRLCAIAAAASLLLLGACVHPRAVAPAQPPAPAPAIAAAETAPPPQPASAAEPAQPAEPAAAAANAPPAAPAAPAKAARPSTTRSASGNPASVASKPAPAAAAAPPAAALPAAPKPAAAGPTAAQASLDLTSLEQRLRDTKAIGVFTKLSLKNQVDDLLAQFKTFHQGQSKSTLAQLREKYELLLLKVISLLQDGDPPLAAAVSSSREAIWGILADPRKFAQI